MSGHPIVTMIGYLLGAFGLAYIVGFSVISYPVRFWLGGAPAPVVLDAAGPPPKAIPGALGPFGDFLCKLLECPACFGFWTGLVTGLTVRSDSILVAVWLGCATSGSNFILARVTRLV